jgi:hypothetical protein
MITIIAVLSFASGTFAQPHRLVPGKQDIIVIVYEFMLTSSGMPYAIKVSQVFHRSDRSDASRAITDAEKARGADLIATHRYHPRPEEVGKKRYDLILLDTKSRRLNRDARPQQV